MSYTMTVHYWNREDEDVRFVELTTYNQCIALLAERFSLPLLRTIPYFLIIGSLEEATQLIQELETVRKSLHVTCDLESIEEAIHFLRGILDKNKWEDISSIYFW